MITKTAAREIAKLAIQAYLYFESETDTEHAEESAIASFNDDFFSNQPTIVCLCGSTRFYDAFQRANFDETMAGKIVLSVGFYPHSEERQRASWHRPDSDLMRHGETVGITPEQKQALDELHLQKVAMADEVLILNVDGYIGESTARELAYARKLGKVVRFLEPE